MVDLSANCRRWSTLRGANVTRSTLILDRTWLGTETHAGQTPKFRRPRRAGRSLRSMRRLYPELLRGSLLRRP